MGQPVIINIIPESYRKDADIKRLLAYIAGQGNNKDKEKVGYISSYGTNRKHCKAAEQMIKVQKYFGKDSGRRIYHMVISFRGKKKLDAAILSADDVAKEIFKERQVFYAIHTSKKHLHIHFAFNAVSYIDGRKWHKSKKEFADFRADLLSLVENGVCADY